MVRFGAGPKGRPDRAILLVGGRGVRLGPVTDRVPKPLVSVAGWPFLHWLLTDLLRQGVRQFILSTGYRAAQFEPALRRLHRCAGLSIAMRREVEPMGTGGALCLAAKGVEGPFFVVNGDTLVSVDLAKLDERALAHPGSAVMAIREVPDTGRYGAVERRGDRVIGFTLRGDGGAGAINAGVYRLTSALLPPARPAGAFSLEETFLPEWSALGVLQAVESGDTFIDIGVPSDLRRAQRFVPLHWLRPALILPSRIGVISQDLRATMAQWRASGGWIVEESRQTGRRVAPWADLATNSLAALMRTVPLDLARSRRLTRGRFQPVMD